jgi:hypothetical protein
MTIFSSPASLPPETAPQPSQIPPAPWMPLGPLTELWAAFAREATTPDALLAASRAFAALADERDALHALNWLTPSWLPSAPRMGAAADPSVFSLLVAQEAVIEALSRAATHWYEAARALLDSAEQPATSEREEETESPTLDLEALISYTLSQRVRVWAIAHSLLADQVQHLSPHQVQQEEEGAP